MSSLLAAAEEVQAILGHQFKNPQLLLEALKAAGSGFTSYHSRSAMDGNKRLAHVGNALLRMILLDDWYQSGAERAIGNEQVSKIGSTENLGDRGRRSGLDGYIYTNPSQGNQPPSVAVVARTVEALLSAVWYDTQKDAETVRRVIRNLSLA